MQIFLICPRLLGNLTYKTYICVVFRVFNGSDLVKEISSSKNILQKHLKWKMPAERHGLTHGALLPQHKRRDRGGDNRVEQWHRCGPTPPGALGSPWGRTQAAQGPWALDPAVAGSPHPRAVAAGPSFPKARQRLTSAHHPVKTREHHAWT